MPVAQAEAAVASSASAELLFTAGAAVLRGELALHDREYELLAELNTAAAGHYGNMADLAAGLGVFASALNAKDASFTPFLGVMDAIEGQARIGNPGESFARAGCSPHRMCASFLRCASSRRSSPRLTATRDVWRRA
jgi:hypothetical protein